MSEGKENGLSVPTQLNGNVLYVDRNYVDRPGGKGDRDVE